MSIHSVKREQCHLVWDKNIPPILTISSGETVTFDCLDASNGQITATSDVSSVASMTLSQLDQVNGPIYVQSAQPGDVLKVEVLEVKTANWGWTGLIPGFGLLAHDEEFREARIKVWELEYPEGGGEGIAWFDKEKGIKIPLRPFAGEMGVARGDEGQFSTILPYQTGGNIDTKYLTKGSTLYLPIECPGALFSIGDGHAAQGDGEVCGTAIETPMTVSVRLTVIKDKKYIQTPHFKTEVPKESAGEYYCTTGVGPDMLETTKAAVRNMITFLGEEHGLSRVEGYMLCSVAGDLRLCEVVDMPNFVVGMMIPKSIFGHMK